LRATQPVSPVATVDLDPFDVHVHGLVVAGGVGEAYLQAGRAFIILFAGREGKGGKSGQGEK
jgi:hypothetical protein